MIKGFFQSDCILEDGEKRNQRYWAHKKITTLALAYHEHPDIKNFSENSMGYLGIKTLLDGALDDYSLHNHDFFQLFLFTAFHYLYDKIIDENIGEIPRNIKK